MTTAKEYPCLLKKLHSDSVIYLKRKDKIAQAVSYEIADQTNEWSKSTGTRLITPEYNFKNIKKRHFGVMRQERFWETFFCRFEVNPFRVVYEDYLNNMKASLLKAAEYLDVEVDSFESVGIPLPTQQRDEISTHWIERYIVTAHPLGAIFLSSEDKSVVCDVQALYSTIRYGESQHSVGS
jgi:LPS sulfotransferase NodH